MSCHQLYSGRVATTLPTEAETGRREGWFSFIRVAVLAHLTTECWVCVWRILRAELVGLKMQTGISSQCFPWANNPGVVGARTLLGICRAHGVVARN